MSALKIHKITFSQASAVAAFPELFDEPPDVEALEIFLSDPQNHLFVAYIDEEPAGFATAYELQPIITKRKQMFLYEIGVSPNFTRRGVASALINELKKICHEQNFAEMFVLTNEANLAAMRLYRSNGGERDNQDDVMFAFSFGKKISV